MKKFTKDLSKLESSPAEGSFDLIFEELKKDKTTKSWPVQFVLLGLLILASISYFTFYKNIQNNQSPEIVKIEKLEQKVPKSQSNGAGIDASFPPESKEIVSGSTKEQMDHKSTKNSKNNPTTQNITSSQSNNPEINKTTTNSSTPKSNKIKSGKLTFDPQKESIVENSSATVLRKQDRPKLKGNELAKSSSNNLINILPSDNAKVEAPSFEVLDPLTQENFQINYNSETASLYRIEIPERTKAFSSRLSISIFTERSSLDFCNFTNAALTAYGGKLSLPLSRKISLGLGVSKNKINYSFEFISSLQSRFGETNKYPVLALFNERVTHISNTLDYYSLDLNVSYLLFSTRRHSIAYELAQEVIFSQNQLFKYNLSEALDYNYSQKSSKLQLGRISAAITYAYNFSKISVFAKGKYGITPNYIGLEKEKYSSLGFELGLKFSLL